MESETCAETVPVSSANQNAISSSHDGVAEVPGSKIEKVGNSANTTHLVGNEGESLERSKACNSTSTCNSSSTAEKPGPKAVNQDDDDDADKNTAEKKKEPEAMTDPKPSATNTESSSNVAQSTKSDTKEEPKKTVNDTKKENCNIEDKKEASTKDSNAIGCNNKKTLEDNSINKQEQSSVDNVKTNQVSTTIKQQDNDIDNKKIDSSSTKPSVDSKKDNAKATNNNKTALESLRESPSPLLAGSSSKKPPSGRRYSSTTGSPERPPVGYRKLSIQPRTTQYEPHPLLQAHTEQGGSALDELLSERQFYNPDLKLQPRCNQYEKGALLERNASGLTELEMYLQEREKELVRNPMTKASSVDSTSSASSRRAMLLRQQSMPERPRLEPRVLQFEQHALLAEKDNSGMSILDAFLAEKEQDIEGGSDNSSITSKGKCSEKCTCKNANCPICKGPSSKSSVSTTSVSSSSGSHPPLIKKESSRETVIEPKANNKRVHFSESGEDDNNDPAANTTDNKPPPSSSPSKQNNTDNNIANQGAGHMDNKTRTPEQKCKAKAKRKCVIS